MTKNHVIAGLIVVIILLIAYIHNGSYQCQGLNVVLENYPKAENVND
jgi:hypothetical protein